MIGGGDGGGLEGVKVGGDNMDRASSMVAEGESYDCPMCHSKDKALAGELRQLH